MAVNRKRAKVGGEVAMNGEFYRGGEFLPSTTNPSNPKTHQKVAAPKKVEIAPYVWDYAPEGMQSIYRAIAGVFGKVIAGKLVINASDITFAYYKKDREEIEKLASLWNEGQRWY